MRVEMSAPGGVLARGGLLPGGGLLRGVCSQGAPPKKFVYFFLFLFLFLYFVLISLGTTPPPEAHSSIWSTRSRYASYWNAFLFVEPITRIHCNPVKVLFYLCLAFSIP